MKLKRLLAAALAGVMAMTSSVVTSVTANAEDVTIKEISQADIAISELTNVTKVKLYFDLDTIGNEWATLTVYANNDVSNWKQETFAPTAAYNNGAGQDWQANNEITAAGSFTSTLDFTSTGSTWYQVGLKTSDAGLSPEVTRIEFLNSSSVVVATYDPNVASIGVDNFKYSTMSNTAMAIGDKVTISYDSTNTPVNAKYAIKYKVDNNGSTEYYAPVYNNAVNGTEGQAATGLEVTSSTSGAVTTYTFTAVSASVGTFEINVETSAAGDWSDTAYLWFGSATSFFVPEVEDEPVEDEEDFETGTYDDGKWAELSAEELAAAGTLNTIATAKDEYVTTTNTLSVQYNANEQKLRIYKLYNEADLTGKSSGSIVVKKGNVGLKLTAECVYSKLADGQTAPEGCYYIAWVISGVDDPTEFSYSDITLA